MATVVHEVSTASTSNATSYATTSFTPAIEDLLIVLVYASGTVAANATCTSSAGTTFTLVRRDGATDSLYVFIANSFDTGLAQTVTFDCTGDAATGCNIHVAAIQSMTRTGISAIKQSATNTFASSGTPQAVFSANANTDNATIVAIGNATNSGTPNWSGINAPTGWTELGDIGYNTPATGFEYSARTSGFTGTTITGSNTSASAGRITIVEIDTTAPVITLPRTMIKSGGVIGR